jgi:predicted double-glycine peptidase
VSQHAVVIVGIDQDNVYLLDPAAQSSVITVTHGDFLLAWDEMKFSYAVISKRS